MTRRINGEDLSGAQIRDVDLSGARLRGVLLVGAEIDGVIDGLTRQRGRGGPAHRGRTRPPASRAPLLRPTTADGAREAVAVVTSLWAGTTNGGNRTPTGSAHGEWTLTETLRHLVFVVDAWFGHALLNESAPFHPAGLPPSFVTDGPAFGIGPAEAPTFDDAVRLHTDRLNRVSAFLATATGDDLTKTRGPNPAPGFPPPAGRTAIECLRVLFNEEWAHHRYAVRDLAVLRQTDQP